MNTSTVSSKYQIVIPKELRKKFQIKPGQKIRLEQNKKGELVINTKSPIDEYYGMFAGSNIWGKDPVKTIRKMRDEWDD
ncbi:MAG TPA: AbrB/MazE/SpoVT family DNA-binding domain-containing protein [Candidatus Saccharimonadales bacterium]|jgi:AbrB family looped-hinge helix DNA binding protein